MADTACTTNCNASACCCDARLKRLERRVCWIRTGLLIALGVLLLLIGIGIGKGGDRREAMRDRAAAMMQRRGMMRGMGAPNMGPGPMAPPMHDRMGPGPRGDRGPDGPRDGQPNDDAPRRRGGPKSN